jgi:hypothetical protein
MAYERGGHWYKSRRKGGAPSLSIGSQGAAYRAAILDSSVNIAWVALLSPAAFANMITPISREG